MKNKLNQINQFNGGMIKDVEPLMTPNTVMTDCLNGTLITYNGNEYALQNDMGNYGFKNGALSNGFVPVGMKEHQGVLYIISYNPIDNKVEIGSFPSQKTIFTPTVDGKDVEIKDLTLTSGYQYYNTVESKTEIKVFSKEMDFFLNPGDKYLLVATDPKGSSFKEILAELNKNSYWKHLVPYILSDENKLYNVDGFLELQADKVITNRADYIPVSWDIPGWLAVKFSVSVPEQFNIYFDKSKVYIDNTDKSKIKVYPSGDLKVQTYWELTNYTNDDLENICKNLKYILHKDQEALNGNSLNGDNIIVPDEGSNTIINYNRFQNIIYYTISSDMLKDYKYITPVLNTDAGNIVYGQFTQPIFRDAIEIDPNEIQFGTESFKYFVGDNSLTILSSWDSFPGVNLEYRLKRYSLDGERLISIDWTKVSDLPVSGTVIIDVSFSQDNSDTYTSEDTKKANFNKEDIYFLELRYSIDTSAGDHIVGPIKGWEENNKEMIYVTEIVNRWYYVKENFKEIEPLDIVNSISDYVNITLNPDNYNFVNTQFLRKHYGATEEPIQGYEFNKDSGYFSKIQLMYPTEFDNLYDSPNAGSKTIFKQGSTYTLEKSGEDDIYTIERLKDQNGDDGRLWRGLTVQKNDMNNGKMVDSKGNTYTLNYNQDNDNFSFDLFNTFTVSSSEYNITKEESINDKFLYEYQPFGQRKTKYDKNTGKLSYSPAYVEFRKDRGGVKDDTFSLCFWNCTQQLDVTFKENKLYNNGREIDPDNYWPFLDLRITGGSWNRTDWKPDAHSAKSAKSYSDDYGFNIYDFYNAKYPDGHSGDSDLQGYYGGGHNFCIAIPFEDKDSWPCIFYPSNKPPTKADASYISKVCTYTYLMILFCIRHCLQTKNVTKYYSIYNYAESLMKSVYIKTINLSGTYTWKYFMNEGKITPEEISVFNDLFTDSNTLLSTNTNVNFNCIITVDDFFKESLQRKIDEKNSDVRKDVDDLEKQADIKPNSLYIINEYNEEKNKVKLSSMFKTLLYSDQLRANIGDALQLYMRKNDNSRNSPSVGREFYTHLYSND